MLRRRVAFAIARRFAELERLVFLDESGAKTNLTRLYGRARGGDRCHDTASHGHWQTLTMLSALRCDGVIREATAVYEGAMNSPTFLNYVESCLAPSLRAGDVVVMDNLAAHHAAGVVEAIEAVGACVWYLPPYSPDLNPIEKLWSKVKSYLRRVHAGTVDALTDAIADALSDVRPAECMNYFEACGYGDKIGEPL